MNKNSALYQLMDIQVNEGPNWITQADEKYHEISKRSNELNLQEIVVAAMNERLSDKSKYRFSHQCLSNNHH